MWLFKLHCLWKYFHTGHTEILKFPQISQVFPSQSDSCLIVEIFFDMPCKLFSRIFPTNFTFPWSFFYGHVDSYKLHIYTKFSENALPYQLFRLKYVYNRTFVTLFTFECFSPICQCKPHMWKQIFCAYFCTFGFTYFKFLWFTSDPLNLLQILWIYFRSFGFTSDPLDLLQILWIIWKNFFSHGSHLCHFQACNMIVKLRNEINL